MRHFVFALTGIIVGTLALTGCTGTAESEEGSGQLAPAFPEGTGQQPAGTKAYPEGPYGIGKGSIIANYKFIGYANSVLSTASLQSIELADFYNPTKNGTYPAGSVMGEGNALPKGLELDIASVWCGPCNYEAKNILPGLYAKYKPMGGEILLQLAEGPTPGKAATSKSLFNWTTKYDVDYPATIDPTYKLSALFDQDAYPTNIIVDTATMKIVEVLAGAPEEGSPFWKTYEKVLAGTL